ncbi:MAG: hypothetical protein K2M46_03590 [Lachnospiraceae bacterium]|nr:hypothetical protein [Lachnospiraceae bacterium]
MSCPSFTEDGFRCQPRDSWQPVVVFFRQSKDKLAFDRYQVRSSKGIRRYWLR